VLCPGARRGRVPLRTARQRIDAVDQCFARRQQHFEPSALECRLDEHLAQHPLDAVASRVAEVFAERCDACSDALAHLLTELDLHGCFVHQAGVGHLPAFRLRLVRRETREQVCADLLDARVRTLRTLQALLLAQLVVHELAEAFSDLRQKADRILAGFDVLEVLVEDLLAATLELTVRQGILHRNQRAT
jgi:hypothetical protein